MELDFDVGTMRLLNSAALQRNAQESQVPMEMSERGPLVHVRSHDAGHWAMIDITAPLAHVVTAKMYDYLLEEGKLQETVYQSAEHPRQRYVPGGRGRVHELCLGPYVHHHLTVTVTTETPRLGYFYWSRYRCIFDFPAIGRVYRHLIFRYPEPRELLLRRDGRQIHVTIPATGLQGSGRQGAATKNSP